MVQIKCAYPCVNINQLNLDYAICLILSWNKAFGWAYLSNTHKTLEHFYVYWISPFIGAILAAWIFRVLFPPPVEQKPQKQKRN